MTPSRECGVTSIRCAKCSPPARSIEFIDCRETTKWSRGPCHRIQHLGKGIIERDIEKAVPIPVPKVVIYCGGGFRSALAGDALKKMGYTNVLFDGRRKSKAWRRCRFAEEKG